MKTFITTLLIIFIGCNLFAQNTIKIGSDDQEIKTIFKKEKKDGFYGSISAGYSPIDNKDGMTFSARGCWIMDHFFSFGIGGTGFVNELDQIGLKGLNFSSNDDLKLSGGYGGIIIEPILAPLQPVHLSFPILIGGGAAGSFYNYENFSSYYVNDFFWVVEPEVEFEANFTKWLRIAIYAGYRYTSALNITGISKNALRCYTTGVTLKMGIF